MFELFSLFALELAALAAVEGGGRVAGARFWVLGARCFTLTRAPVSSTGQALSQDGRGGRRGGVLGVRCWVLGMGRFTLTLAPVSSTGQALSLRERGEDRRFG